MTARLAPDSDALTAVLTAVLREAHEPGLRSIESRERNGYESSFSSEVVTVVLEDATRTQLFCKHGASYVNERTGHRRGPAYEAEIYRTVPLSPAARVPRFYGAHASQPGTSLVLEFLAGSVSLNKFPGLAYVRVAEALGTSQRAWARHLPGASHLSVNRYDASHYEVWSSGVRALAASISPRSDLTHVWREPEAFLSPLEESQPVLVHGELYPNNVLLRRGVPYFVDWETAGIGAGELDLATLLLGGWPEEIRREAESAYARARWPGGPPANHERILAAARVYALLTLISHAARRPARARALGWAEAELRVAVRLVA